MKYILRLLLASALALAPVSAQAASGATTVSALDAGSTSRTFNVFSTTGAVSGNLSWMNNICDITTLTVCAAVDAGHSLQVAGEGTAGVAAGGVVTVQGVANMTPILATVSQATASSLNATVVQATASSLNATVVGTGTFATQISAPIVGVTAAVTSAAASSLVAKNSAGSLVSVSGSAAASSYIMVFNATSAPGDGAVTPVKCWGPMGAAGPFVFAWGPGPVLTLSTGITIVSSSTGCFTKTAVSAPFIAVEYQ